MKSQIFKKRGLILLTVWKSVLKQSKVLIGFPEQSLGT